MVAFFASMEFLISTLKVEQPAAASVLQQYVHCHLNQFFPFLFATLLIT